MLMHVSGGNQTQGNHKAGGEGNLSAAVGESNLDANAVQA